MSSDSRLLVRIKDPGTAASLQAAVGEPALTDGDWLVLEDSQDRDETTARELSQRLATTTIWWTIHTVVDQIWLMCFENGQVVRELRYSAEEGWAPRSGAPLAFESPALKKWFRKKNLSASPDGYDLLDCFLGKDTAPVKAIKEPMGKLTVFLPAPLAKEAKAHAKQRGVQLSTVLQAAWELGKTDLWQRERNHTVPDVNGETGSVTLTPRRVALEFTGSPVELKPLPPSNAKVECRLVWPQDSFEELRAMVMALDRPVSWLLKETYLLARPRLGPLEGSP